MHIGTILEAPYRFFTLSPPQDEEGDVPMLDVLDQLTRQQIEAFEHGRVESSSWPALKGTPDGPVASADCIAVITFEGLPGEAISSRARDALLRGGWANEDEFVPITVKQSPRGREALRVFLPNPHRSVADASAADRRRYYYLKGTVPRSAIEEQWDLFRLLTPGRSQIVLRRRVCETIIKAGVTNCEFNGLRDELLLRRGEE